MKYAYFSTSFLLMGALFLGGCSENHNNSVPETDNTLSSIVSSTNTSQTKSTEENSTAESSAQSAPESSPEPVPVEFTDEDRMIQKEIAALLEPAQKIYFFIHDAYTTLDHKFIFPEIGPDICYYSLISNQSPLSEVGLNTPTTCSEAKELMLDYFSEEQTEYLMHYFTACEIIERSDDIYSLRITDGKITSHPTAFVEVDGTLYRRDGVNTANIYILPDSIKILSKTESIIEFIYLPDDEWIRGEPDNAACLTDTTLYSKYAYKGVLKYERDGWKLDSWGIW